MSISFGLTVKMRLCAKERKWAHKTEIRHERWHIKKADKIIDDSRAFSSAIRLIVLVFELNTGNLIKV